MGKSHKRLKSIMCLFFAAALSLSAFSMRSAALENWASNCYVASEGACLMDAASRTVLFSKNADKAYYPASITKVLTALVVLENCDNLSEQVTFSYDAVHIEEENSTIIGASEGDKLSVLDCLYCLLFQSANEVANALAEHVGAKRSDLKEEGMSDRDVFILMMNTKAEELGCTGSHFNNPSGLNDEDHYVTAYDMCLIMAAAVENEEFLEIESRTYWTHAPIARYPDADDPWNTVYPKHSMLKKNNPLYYEGSIAGKTGYTMTAGNTLVTAAERNGMTLVTCVLNAHANHYNDTKRLLDFGFDNFYSVKVSDYDNLNSLIQSDFAIGDISLIDSYTMGVDPGATVAIPKGGNFTEVKKELTINTTEEGKAASATVTYYYGSHMVGRAAMKLVGIGGETGLYEYAGEDRLLREILEEDGELPEEIIPETSAGAFAGEDPGEAPGGNPAEPAGNQVNIAGDGEGGVVSVTVKVITVAGALLIIIAAGVFISRRVSGRAARLKQDEWKRQQVMLRKRRRDARDAKGKFKKN